PALAEAALAQAGAEALGQTALLHQHLAVAEPGLQALRLERRLLAFAVDPHEVQVPDRGQRIVEVGDAARELLAAGRAGLVHAVLERPHAPHGVVLRADVHLDSLRLPELR